MSNILEYESTWSDGRLNIESVSFAELFESVMGGTPAIIHNVFPPSQLTTLRDLVHQWGLATPGQPPQTYMNENFHSIEAGISPRQKTEHNYHAYNFNQLLDGLPSDLQSALFAVAEPLRCFQNRLTGNEATYAPDSEGRKLHPQIIHYPSGGGMFGQHIHGLEPQRIGLILGLSERGRDFDEGGTYFEVDGKIAGTDRTHDIGDMILFRFDIPHGISQIDPELKLDYSSVAGRWTFVLPYY